MIEVQCKILFSAIRIIQVWSELAQFHFPEPPLEDINLIIKYLNSRKASGPDHIPLKVFKFPSHFVDSHLSNVKITLKVLRQARSSLSMIHFKKNKRNKTGNYRLVSILNQMPKIYERFIHDRLSSYFEIILSNFIPAHGKSCNSDHVLLRSI